MPQLATPLRRLAYFSLATGSLYGRDHFYHADSAQRSLRLFKAGALIALDYKLNFNEGAGLEELNKIHERTAKRILDTCLKNGGLYIKFGQAIASQNEILPPQANETFKVLYDSDPVVSSSEVRKLFIDDLGQSPEVMFDEFDWTPVGSASIAQVHKARLKDRTPVAVKVQKPYIKKQINIDLTCQSAMTREVKFMFDIPMSWSLEYTQNHLCLETDFLNEVRNAARAARDFEQVKEFKDDVHVPQVFWEHSSKRVMTAEWIDCVIGLTYLCTVIGHTNLTHHHKPPPLIWNGTVRYGKQVHPHGPATGQLPHQTQPFQSTKGAGCAPRSRAVRGGVSEHAVEVRAVLENFLMVGDVPTLTRISTHWGFGDVSMAATSALMRPYDPAEATKNGLSALAKALSEGNVRRPKAKAKKMLADQHKFPRELIFVMRNISTVRGVNKDFGSPVDRISMTRAQNQAAQPNQARWAMRGTASLESLALVGSSSSTSRATFSWLRLYISENTSLLRFELHLSALSLFVSATKLKALWVACARCARRDGCQVVRGHVFGWGKVIHGDGARGRFG
ncbi:ABC1-domain-containing protein [Gonapodya prolifera JEL478]|uniref:ABC1-domain-containing protein n=1 Tax=Gonapodya prolifera (strain JEL478) TaxID=1344416 RepID=A0A138ZZT8_GONPJ|nr:ABC1-domain-containing protein [Gonapodya prolifera JEL478]|eukprot:KXS09928.1 ABC1-domain-containing protein [Gonapodya prolifera JEL478]